PHVEEDEVEGLGLELLDRAGAVLDRGDLVPRLPEALLEDPAQAVFVVRDQDAGRHGIGVREAGINRRWPEKGTLSSVVSGSARPASTVGGLRKARSAPLYRGPRGRHHPEVASERLAQLRWMGVPEAGTNRRRGR